MPRIRVEPEDFRVTEIPRSRPTGAGEHTWVEVEKRLQTTESIARQLAAAAGVGSDKVGFAGRKDHRAVTRQWFSVPRLPPERCLALVLEGGTVLEAVRHPRRLHLGDLEGNRFQIRVREVARESGLEAIVRLEESARRGFPNRFGEQRFGRDGENARRGAELARGVLAPRDRRSARFLISALQSALFNATLERRSIGIDELRRGDLALRHKTELIVDVLEPEREADRLARFETSPTGPIFGAKMRQPRGETAAEEAAALAAYGLEAEDFRLGRLDLFGLRGERRALRARPAGVHGEWRETEELELEFTLPPGSYATVLVDELLPGARLGEASGDAE